MTAKKKAWEWCSKYIRLRDAIEYQKLWPETPFGYVRCCTCPRIIIWNKNCDAGHFIPKSRGGLSGVYFDERNIHAQCKDCNGFHQGKQVEYKRFMLQRYGQGVIDKLEFLDKNQSYKGKIIGIGLMYKQMYEELYQTEAESIVPDKQKCPKCGFETDTRVVAKDMKAVMMMAEKMDYGEPEVQCPNCLEWFNLQTVESL